MRMRLQRRVGAPSSKASYTMSGNLQHRGIQADTARRSTVNSILGWLCLGLLAGVQGKDSSPEKGMTRTSQGPQSQKDQIGRQSRQNLGPGNKRVKIITRGLVLGTREKPRSLSFSQTSIGGNWEPSFRRPFQSILNLLFLARGIGQGWRGQAEPLRRKRPGLQKEGRGKNQVGLSLAAM